MGSLLGLMHCFFLRALFVQSGFTRMISLIRTQLSDEKGAHSVLFRTSVYIKEEQEKI